MSGETEASVSGWTTDTLHSHLLRLLNERTEEYNARFSAQEQALKLAREADLVAQRGQIQVVETRLHAMDRATSIFREDLIRVPTDVDKQVGHLRTVTDEKFRSIDTQMAVRDREIITRFGERDTRSERESRDNKIAVDAAFAAAKEAVAENNKSSALANAKSEAAFTKQVDTFGLLLANSTKAIDEKIDDLKARLDRGEGRQNGTDRGKEDNRYIVATLISLALMLLSIATLIVYVIASHK